MATLLITWCLLAMLIGPLFGAFIVAGKGIV